MESKGPRSFCGSIELLHIPPGIFRSDPRWNESEGTVKKIEI